MRTNLYKVSAISIAAGFALAGCGDGGGDSLVVGSQEYYSNEIIAEIYAQALENAGHDVTRDFNIGQREVYMPELEEGNIDVFPDYTGNLLQYLDGETTATAPDEVYEELQGALPEGLRILEQAEASDQDSYVVTAELAEEHSLTSIADLAGVDGLVLGGNSEMETRPYGPQGLEEIYGVTAQFTPIEDSGGPLTVQALRDGDVDVANVYSADPVLAEGDLVRLEDPEGMMLASRVVPIVSENVDDEAAAVLDEVSALLGEEELVALNARSVDEQSPAATIASDWLEEQGLLEG